MKKGINSEMPPRERVLHAAAELFYEEGIRGVSMDAIAARAMTTKMAIYRHFNSKDELVTVWLAGVANQYVEAFDELASLHPNDPRGQLQAWVQRAVDSMYAASHRGCPFVNSLAELPDRNHPARQLIERHKEKQASKVEALLRGALVPEPGLAAAELIFLLEGAQVTVQNMSITAVGEKVISMAQRIIDRAKK